MKKFLSVLTVLVLIFTFAAPSTADNSIYEGVMVGYCPPTLTDPWLALIASKLREYTEAVGMTFLATEGNANIQTQIQQFENFIAMGCDIIIAQPVNLAAYQRVIEEARSRGVKVVFWADDPAFDVEACYLSVNSIQGAMAGEMAKKWADETFPDAGPGSIKVAWLTTQMDSRPTARERCEAMINTVLADERFVQVFRKDNLNDTPSALNAMNECLALHKDVNVILAFADAMAMGANSAVMADKSLDYSKIAIFAGDATDEGKALIDQSAANESVFRGSVISGEGDSYFIKGAEILKGVYDGSIELNSVFFADHDTHNTVGYVSTFDAAEYARNYVSPYK